MVHAYHKNLENPGTYATKLNKILTANNLPNLIIPDPSETSNTVIEDEQESQAIALAKDPVTLPRRKKSTSKAGRETESDMSDAEYREHENAEETIEAKAIDLQLYTTEEKKWPAKTFTLKSLVNDLQSNKYKFTYKDSRLTKEQIYDMLLNNKIILRGCWNEIKGDELRKIRSGLTKDRSPAERRDPRVRKLSDNV